MTQYNYMHCVKSFGHVLMSSVLIFCELREYILLRTALKCFFYYNCQCFCSISFVCCTVVWCVAVREKEFSRKLESSGVVYGEREKVKKEIEQLSKMRDSGTAAVILKDLKKKMAESPVLDPRNASRTPSASVEPLQKPRYETPYFACECTVLLCCECSAAVIWNLTSSFFIA